METRIDAPGALAHGRPERVELLPRRHERLLDDRARPEGDGVRRERRMRVMVAGDAVHVVALVGPRFGGGVEAELAAGVRAGLQRIDLVHGLEPQAWIEVRDHDGLGVVAEAEERRAERSPAGWRNRRRPLADGRRRWQRQARPRAAGDGRAEPIEARQGGLRRADVQRQPGQPVPAFERQRPDLGVEVGRVVVEQHAAGIDEPAPGVVLYRTHEAGREDDPLNRHRMARRDEEHRRAGGQRLASSGLDDAAGADGQHLLVPAPFGEAGSDLPPDLAGPDLAHVVRHPPPIPPGDEVEVVDAPQPQPCRHLHAAGARVAVLVEIAIRPVTTRENEHGYSWTPIMGKKRAAPV